MAPTLRVVLDVLKPHDPSLVTLADRLSDLSGVEGVNATLLETDRDVENVKLTIAGRDVDVEHVRAAIEDLGGTIHSVDEVVCGERVVEAGETPQNAR